MDKQGQIDKHSCWGHVLFAKSCSPCPLPVWPVITEWLSLSADYRRPCVDPFNLQSKHMMAAFAPEPQAAGHAHPPTQEKLKNHLIAATLQ